MAGTNKPSPIFLVLFAFVTALASTLALAPPAAAAVPTWTTALASQPSGATLQRQGANDIACPAAGACVVVGYFDGFTPQARLFIDTTSDGRVVSSVEPPLPRDALGPPYQTDQQLSSVSCWAVGSCVAVGEYTTAHDQGGLIETLHNGIWTARGSSAGTGLNRELDEVACNSTQCVATGSSLGASVLVRDAGRTWHVRAVTTVATTSALRVEHPSCPPTGACFLTVVAGYGTPQERALFGYPSGAGWNAVYFPIPTLGDPEQLYVDSLSCPVDGVCVGFGSYQEQGTLLYHPIAEKFSAGQLSVSMLPTPGFDEGVEWYGERVACATVTRCVGFAYGISRTLLYRLTATGWKGKVAAEQNLHPLDASCSQQGACVIAGADGQGNPYVLTLTQARWAPTTLSLPPTKWPSDQGYLGVIRCVARTCVAAGKATSSDITYRFFSRTLIAVGRSVPTS